MSFLSLFRKKQKPAKPAEDQVLRSKVIIDILAKYEEYEQQGLLCIAPLHHRVTVAHPLAALFTQDANTLELFFRGVALYATYQYVRLTTGTVLAKLELEAKEARRKELGRELTDEESAIARMQAYANSDVTQVIDRDIYFDITVVTPDSQEPVVIAHVKDGKVEVLSVQE